MAARRYPRILAPPKGSFFLYGVRGVGKSTWARETFPDAHIIGLSTKAGIRRCWPTPHWSGWSCERWRPTGRRIDESSVPALLNEVHRAIEGTRRRFVLLGSARAG
jgi:hypothetical protein